ncbi:DUF427 domain-containing protein [Dactylosporangium sp. NPDC051485]|uniref:DUF427 domain-containing protein n=1 Tax=Dactylosporangium sp. NPDC051485 TaxID=3154846 RepID=UPI00341951E0
MQRPLESVWDYPRPPRVEPTPRHIVVRHAGRTVADSRRAVRVLETSNPPVYYIPRDDVAARLEPSRTSTVCEFKGVAGYWDLHVGDSVIHDAAWEYPAPSAGYEVLRGRLAFYPGRVDECTVDGERVVPQLGDFYGGWVTAEITGPIKGGPGTQDW